MSVKRTSSIWPVMAEVVRILKDVRWPRIPEIEQPPAVRLGAVVLTQPGELIVLSGTTERGDQDWATQGSPGKNEVVQAPIVITSIVPGFSPEQAYARLSELATTLEMGFRNQETGQPIMTDALTEAGVWQIQVVAVGSSLYPVNAPGANGWEATADLVLTWSARL